MKQVGSAQKLVAEAVLLETKPLPVFGLSLSGVWKDEKKGEKM